jgi:hypothetical protein
MQVVSNPIQVIIASYSPWPHARENLSITEWNANIDRSTKEGLLLPLRPGTNWADWSDVMGREMYLHRALDRLNFEYPSNDAS